MKFNNILLIYPRPSKDKSPRFGFSIQLMQIAELIKQRGYNTFYLDYSYQDFIPSGFVNYISENEIDLCIIEVDSFALKRSENIENATEMLGMISDLNKKSIVFGNSCILDNDRIFPADIIIRDDPFKSIIKNIHILEGNSFAGDGWEYDFDDIPFPDRELLLTNDFFNQNSNSTLVKTAEGCLNSCTFCQRRGWQKVYRAHSLEYVVGEFRLLNSKGYKNIWINDENFTFDLKRAKEILRALISEKITVNMKIAISSWTRIDTEFLDLSKSAGVSIISFGIESANADILKFYNKDIDLNKTRELIEYADSIGIYTVGNFIIGAPMETLKTISATFDYIMESSLDQVNIKILDFMIGSELYETLNRKDERHYFACSENGLNNFPLNQLIRLKGDFLSKFKLNRSEHLMKKIQRYGSPYFPIVR